MPKFGLNDKFDELLEEAPVTDEEKERLRTNIQQDLEEPVKIIGAGQAGVGKSTLLRSIFAVEEEDIPEEITTDATSAETDEFQCFQIESEDGFKIRFTDGPGLGESIEKDKELIPKWIDEIQEHDLVYWVLDASSRDFRHIQENIRKIMDETGYRDRIVVVLNKVDQIELEESERNEGLEGWNEKYNVPTDELEAQIERRTDDIVEKLSRVGIPENKIVACSALKRWNHGEVLDTLVESLPPEEQIKVSANRDVADIKELVSDDVLSDLD